jgi:nucleoside-diphosphate-sugar epimerase
MTRVLVTGASGYVGTHLAAALLRDGREVRGVVRTPEREQELRDAVRAGGADDGGLEVVFAELMADDGWAAAVDGCGEVHHVASPIPAAQPDDPDELIVPAREGVLRVLRAARDGGARRVVLTSSFAAIGYSRTPDSEYTEANWTDPDMPGLAPYPRSKTIAERAAWDFAEAEGGATELVSVNPTFILGPTLTPRAGSSMQFLQRAFSGQLTVWPRQRFGIADVRDVADLHVRAMAAPEAAGKRYLAVSSAPAMSWRELGETLRAEFGELAAQVSTEEAPGDELPQPVIHNERARTELGWEPRDPRQTIVDTVQRLRELDILMG